MPWAIRREASCSGGTFGADPVGMWREPQRPGCQTSEQVRQRVSTLRFTYSIAVAVLFLDRLYSDPKATPDPADRQLIQTLALRLIANQNFRRAGDTIVGFWAREKGATSGRHWQRTAIAPATSSNPRRKAPAMTTRSVNSSPWRYGPPASTRFLSADRCWLWNNAIGVNKNPTVAGAITISIPICAIPQPAPP